MNGWSRHTIWFSRSVLLIASVLFFAIASKNLADPAPAGAPFAISFGSAAGITVGRVGFGAFPLSFAFILVACLTSERRFLIGLRVLGTVAVVLTAVRIVGLVVDGPAAFTLKVLKPEIALVLLSAAAIYLEKKRREHLTGEETPGGPAHGIARRPSEQS